MLCAQSLQTSCNLIENATHKRNELCVLGKATHPALKAVNESEVTKDIFYAYSKALKHSAEIHNTNKTQYDLKGLWAIEAIQTARKKKYNFTLYSLENLIGHVLDTNNLVHYRKIVS